MIRAFLLGAWLALTLPAVAMADPISAAVVTFFGFAEGSVAAAVATFIVNTALYTLASLAISKLTAPKQTAGGQDRQASVLALSIGERPRELIVGAAVTGGQLLDAFNFGGANGTDWEVMVIKLADHEVESLEGFYVGDAYYAFTASGVQSGFASQLEVYYQEGGLAQSYSGYLATNSPSRLSGEPWTTDDRVAGCAYVVAAYKIDAPNAANPVWQGRPQFRWHVKGKRFYDPRLDSTVTGGAGAHRWADPTTWEWSENAAICHYGYRRGVYAGDQVADPQQLLLGRGLSATEAPPERVIAYANACDEAVALKAGGTEPRYRVGGVIAADQPFIQVDEWFAAAMAGVILQHEGSIEVAPGVAQASVRTITDADLLVGAARSFEDFLPEAQLVNQVSARYAEPAQLWKNIGAPVRRSTADMIADGGLKDKPLSLDLVTSGTQAQRCAEIERRLGRLEKRSLLPLAPIHSDLEAGDWLTHTSDRWLMGESRTFRLELVTVGEGRLTTAVTREISAWVYEWDETTDESVPGEAPVDSAGELAALALAGVDIQAFDYLGGDGQQVPGVIADWDTPLDPAIKAVRLELRVDGSTEIAATIANDPGAGHMTTTNGVPSSTHLQGRLVPMAVEGRRCTPSAWVDVNSGDLAAKYLLGAGGLLLTFADVQNALNSIPAKNLWRKQDWAATGGAALVDPMTLGDARWGFTIPGDTPAAKVYGVPAGWGLTATLAYYSLSFAAKINTGTGQIRAGFRDTLGNPIAGLADEIFPLSTTLTRLTWEGITSNDAAFPTATLYIFQESGDVAAGRTVSITDLGLEYGPTASNGWRPSPNDVDLLRYAGYVGSLDATRNTIFRQSSAPSSPANGDIWADTTTTPQVLKVYFLGTWCVAAADGGAFGSNLYHTPGGTLATLSAFLTSSGTAAAITGQGPLATAANPVATLQYLDGNGQFSDWRGFGNPNGAVGMGAVFDVNPLTADDRYCYIAAFNLKGQNYTRSCSSATLDFGAANTTFGVVMHWAGGYYGLISVDDIDLYVSAGGWLYLGTVKTSSGGVFTPPASIYDGYIPDFGGVYGGVIP